MNAPVVHFSVPLRHVGTAYLWWFFVGGLGAHKFYLGRPAMGVLYACTLGLLGIGMLYDLFTLPSQVRAANAAMMSGNRSAGDPPVATGHATAPDEPLDP